MAKNQINPKGLPWFPFYVAAWLGSPDVLAMRDAERGIYMQLLANVWLYGSVPADPWKLSQVLHTRYETTTKWLQKWSHLVAVVESSRSGRVAVVESSCSRLVVPKLQEFAETLEKNAPLKIQSRRDETRVDETNDTNGGRPSSDAPKPIVSPSVTETKTKAKAVPVTDMPDPATPATPVKLLGDIRDWDEEKSGIPAERLRNCIVYQLDYAKDDYFRKSEITPASMERSKFITLLNDNTPAGWTPEKNSTYTRKPKAATAAPAEPSKYQFKESI